MANEPLVPVEVQSVHPRFRGQGPPARAKRAPGDGRVDGFQHDAAAEALSGRQEGHRALHAAAAVRRELRHLGLRGMVLAPV